MHGLKIEIPASLADIVGVTDFMPELRPATADFTYFCHEYTPRLSGAEPTKISLSDQVVFRYQGMFRTETRSFPSINSLVFSRVARWLCRK